MSLKKLAAVELSVLEGVAGCTWPNASSIILIITAVWQLRKRPTVSASTDVLQNFRVDVGDVFFV